MKYIANILIVVALFCFVLPVSAEEGKKINATSIVLGHVKDSHEWHITGEGEKAVIIPLPVIVNTSTGWHVFCTSQFEPEQEGKELRQGPYGLALAEEGEYAGKIVEKAADGTYAPVALDLSITKTVANMFIDVFILILCIVIPSHWYRKHKATDPAPSGFTGLVEMLVMYVQDDIIKPGIGKGYEKYCPYLMSAFFFIFVCNLMGLIPFGGNVTGNIAITFFLAVCTFIVTQFSGNKHYWKDIFWPEVPGPVKILMIPIEFVGIFTKPFALMIRLFANMLAGHAIALALTCIIFIVGATMSSAWLYGLGTFSIILSVCMMCLELLVCFLQAMVFTMLSATFIGLAKAEPEE